MLSTKTKFNYHVPAVGENSILEASPSQTNQSSCSLTDGSQGRKLEKICIWEKAWEWLEQWPWKGLGAPKGWCGWGRGEGKSECRAGLTLTLVHLPHSARLRAPASGAIQGRNRVGEGPILEDLLHA